MLRHIAAVCLLAFVAAAVAPAARGDIVIHEERNDRLDVEGIRSRVEVNGERIEVTPGNAAQFVEQSYGVIVKDGYAEVDIRRSERASRGKVIPRSKVRAIYYSNLPAALLAGDNSRAVAAWAQAIASYQRVYNDKEQRDVFRLEAAYKIGLCYVQAGNYRSAISHFRKWPSKTSRYTPEVYRLLAELLTLGRKYEEAGQWYDKIKALENIPEDWKFKADLGRVKLLLAQKDFGRAETEAKKIVITTRGKKELADAYAAALTAQSKAVRGEQLQAQATDRLPEAEKLASDAAGVEGTSATTKAEAYVALGDALYAQNKLLDARFPYLRVACLYPEERGYVASALQNAGQIFLDLALREESGTPKRKDLLIKGMKLLEECGRDYRGTAAASKARQTWVQHKAEYEAAKQQAEKAAAKEG